MPTHLPLLSQLIYALRALPGVGPRSAERLAYHLLHSREQSLSLAEIIKQTLNTLQACEQCQTYTETSVCQHCANPKRDSTLLCIVETPLDLLAIEQSGAYQGNYFVLMGKISPLEGIGPSELGLDKLVRRIQTADIKEIIFALSPTVEGQTTLHCIQTLLQSFSLQFSQLARGIPLGSELALLDSFTISSAMVNRSLLSV